MEQKKSRKADLEGKRNTFFLVGLVITLGLVFMAFEWKSKPKKVEFSGGTPVSYVEDLAMPLIREHKERPKPPNPVVVEKINIVGDEVDILEELNIEPSDPTDYEPVEIPEFVKNTRSEPEEEIFPNFVDEPAEFPGGERALYRYISEHVKYPVIAQENGIKGKVYVQFVVDENGNIVNAHVSRASDPSLDAEALRVIQSLPKFKPARQAGKFVKVYYTAVINFQLQ